MAEVTKKNSSNVAFLIAIWSAVLVTLFVAFRSSDLLKLPSLVGNLGGGPLFGGEGVLASIGGLAVAGLILIAWHGTGTFLFRYLKTERGDAHAPLLEIVQNIAVGAAITSLLWFFLGLLGLYSSITAIIVTGIGLIEGGLSLIRVLRGRAKSDLSEKVNGFDKLLMFLPLLPLGLAVVGAIAPPIAKDTLLYHFSVPKAFIAQGSSGFIEGNIASYLALGTEMHIVWARLIGGLSDQRTAEIAGGTVVFLFFPLLLAAIYGWARETGISKRWALVAMLMVAAVPTAYHVASSGYVDLALALFVTLAIRSLCRWWKSQDQRSMILVGIFLGAALSVKLTALFVIAAFALVILLRARGHHEPDEAAGSSDVRRILLTGFGALLLAGMFASPWYLRTWVATGSPVFPFYMSIWKGTANGWDVERSNLFQSMNSQYGGAAANPVNYVTAPLRVSLAAQPEDPQLYDGVLGPMFLIGLPLVIWAFWKRNVPIEAKIAAGVAGIMYLFWLFSSAQLRYLLPIVPAFALAVAASVEALAGRRDPLDKAVRFSLAGASLLCIATSFAWFCQKAPLRVTLGGETRDEYLSRNLDYFPYYREINSNTTPDSKVWLINMRRDTYNIERPVFSDYLFEDWTLRKMVWESQSAQELRTKAAALGIRYVLTRHDFLFDYTTSTLVDDKKPRAENEGKLKIAKEFILDPTNTVKADSKFSLVKVFSEK